MKHHVLKSSCTLLIGMMAALAPLTATQAQDYSPSRPYAGPSAATSYSNEPSAIEGTSTIQPDVAAPSTQEHVAPRYDEKQQWMGQPRGPQGPIRSNPMNPSARKDVNPDSLKTTDRGVDWLPEYEKRVDSAFRSD